MQTSNRVLQCLAAALVLLPACYRAEAQPKSDFDHAGVAKRALEAHIRPGYRRLAEAGAVFERAMSAHCERNELKSRASAIKAFDAFVTAWGRIEHITFGPIMVENRIDRILFFPDRRGLGVRQIAAALHSQDPSVTRAETLSAKSVALQGLTAFEAVLLTQADRSEPRAAMEHRCRFGLAIASNFATIANAVSREWEQADGYAKLWLEPGPGNRVFLKRTETTLALAKAMGRGIEQVRDERIVAPLGFGPQRRKMPAVLQASGRTMRLVQANIDGLRELWETGGIADAVAAAGTGMLNGGVPDLAALVSSELQTASKHADRVIAEKAPFERDSTRSIIISMGFPLKNARYQATRLLTEVAGVTLGFNSSDGD